MRTKKLFWVLVASLALALSLPAAALQGKSQGKGKAGEKGKPTAEEAQGKSQGKGKSHDDDEVTEEIEREAAKGRAFGRHERRAIREFFGHEENLQGLPPGLAKREELPPGLQRHLERHGQLPPGLQKRLQPFPEALNARLGPTPKGITRGVLNGNVVLVEQSSSRVLDIISNVVALAID